VRISSTPGIFSFGWMSTGMPRPSSATCSEPSKQRDIDALAVAGERLVDAVVDDLVGEMIRPTGVGVHAGTATHRVETLRTSMSAAS
jgi:hypothetical protein